jgi:hypothetical protein
VGCGPDVWGRSVPHFEGRQLGRLEAEHRELLALVICLPITLISFPRVLLFELMEVRTWKIGIDERAVHRFGTGVWEPGFRSG